MQTTHNAAGKTPWMSRVTSGARQSLNRLPRLNSKRGAQVYALPMILFAVGGYFLFKRFRDQRSGSDLDLIGQQTAQSGVY